MTFTRSMSARAAWLAVVPVTLALAVDHARAGDPIVTSDLLRLRSVSTIDVAWDGAHAVLAVRSIEAVSGPRSGGEPDSGEDERPQYSNRSHLFLLDLTTPDATPRQLTFGDRSDGSPALSPDGNELAFVRRGEDDGAPQVWVLPLDGGEARPVTTLVRGAGSPRWSPDGRKLLVTSPVPVEELPGTPPWIDERPFGTPTHAASPDGIEPRPDGSREEIRAWLAENAAAADPTVITRLEFQDEQSLRESLSFSQLFLVDPRAPDVAPVQITRSFRTHGQARFIPGGDRIVFTARSPSDRHPDRVRERSLWQVASDGTNERPLVTLAGWTLRDPRPSRDGSVIALVGARSDESAFRLRRLGVCSVDAESASEPVWLTESFDETIWSVGWFPSRSALLFTTPRAGGVPLEMMSLGLLEPATVVAEHEGEPVGVGAFSAGGGTVVYAQTTVSDPCVVRVSDARGDRLAWDLNAWVHDKDLARPEAAWLTRPDGTRVQYWLMKPTRHDADTPHPLVLEIHGGPSSMWGPGEFTMWHEFQLLCAWGYAVVYANPRGSGGYGYDFRYANFQDWGQGPGGDVLAAVDQVLLSGDFDPDRLVVTGGSYGGYLTAWIIAHDHRFKGAVAQRGVYDFATFFGEGNAWRLVDRAMGGDPWDARIRPILQRESPFSAVNRIRTPLLIMHASRDLRTGVSQSEMLYRALKELDRPVEYVRYPAAGHDLSRTGDPLQRMDRLNRILDFFDRAVGNELAAPR